MNNAEGRFVTALHGFGPVGLVTLLLILLAGNLVGAALVIVWAVVSKTPWPRLGLGPSKSWIRTVAVGVLAGTALKLFMKSVVMPLLGANPMNAAYHGVFGNRTALFGLLFTVVVGGGFGEELIWRGYLFDRLGTLLGPGWRNRAAVLLTTALLFALAHYPDQGVAGAEQAVVTGLVFGGMFLATEQLWLPMVTHAAFDVTAVLLIYRGLESSVAHWIFR